MPKQTTEWAVALLRPILQQLNVQHLEKASHIVRASEHHGLVGAGMGKWVITAQQADLQKRDSSCTIVHDKEHGLFLFSLNVDAHLFASNELELRTKRKRAAVHEFVHGFAYMYNSTVFPIKDFCELAEQSMNSAIKMSSDDNEFNAILSALDTDTRGVVIPSDGHFRMTEDGFPGNYSELYASLLLSYQLICEFMEDIKQQKQAKGVNFSELLRLTIDNLVEQKALDREFVKERIQLVLNRLYLDFYN
jgi:hypothetical protein